ncbi:MAG TPA: polysaccharide biosynthesis tyrosine autokinase [Arcobacter sp.]|nr:polysaccharide biosynthesis tyrosine autokinase [Arcobacter sp.]
MSENNYQEVKLKEILNILKKYKWSIMFITIITTILSYGYVYMKESSYVSYSIIKVKANEKTKSSDLINSATSTSKSKSVLEEISLLKTFKINKQALNNVSFKIRYFIKENYRTSELYTTEVPIELVNIKILKKIIIGKMLTLTPTNTGYTLSYAIPYKTKIKKFLFQKDEFEFNFERIHNHPYGKMLKNEYIQLKVNKKSDFSKPIHFMVYDSNRDIFENSIYDKLNIKQLEEDTSLIKIEFQDTIPQRANLYVDALTASFINYSIESKNTQNNKTLNFITEELKNIKQELKDSEKKLETHQLSKNIVKPSIQASLYIKNLSDIEIEISENRLKKKLISNLISFVKDNYNLDAIAPSISKLDDQTILSLITKLQDSQFIEDELVLEYTEEYPKLKSIRKKISSIRHKIEYNLKSLRTSIDYKNTSLLKRKDSYNETMKKLPSKERELVNIKRNYEVKSKMYEYLLKKEAENKIIQLATFSDYQIIDNAYNSHIPVSPKRLFILGSSFLLALLLGMSLALIRNARNSYIQNKDVLESITSLAIYGTLPYYKQAKNTISVHKNVKSPFSEGFRSLRTNLQFKTQNNKSSIILITSTIGGEGKSTTSANLATILEMAKYKTIVINFDLRKPTLHNFFNINNDKGVSTFLQNQDSLEDIIASTEFANLDIIPSGPIPMDPSELILSKKLPLLFEKLKEKYEYIIIDTGPIGIVSDTKMLMQYSDLNLILIREDYARKEFLLTIEEMINKHHFKNVGLILNASKAKGGEYGYGYSYEYKYK